MRGRLDGRANRAEYTINIIFYTVVSLLVFTGLMVYLTSVEPSVLTALAVIAFALLLIFILGQIIFPLTIRRLQDIGISFLFAGIISLMLFVPILNIVLAVNCLFTPSERE